MTIHKLDHLLIHWVFWLLLPCNLSYNGTTEAYMTTEIRERWMVQYTHVGFWYPFWCRQILPTGRSNTDTGSLYQRHMVHLCTPIYFNTNILQLVQIQYIGNFFPSLKHFNFLPYVSFFLSSTLAFCFPFASSQVASPLHIIHMVDFSFCLPWAKITLQTTMMSLNTNNYLRQRKEKVVMGEEKVNTIIISPHSQSWETDSPQQAKLKEKPAWAIPVFWGLAW